MAVKRRSPASTRRAAARRPSPARTRGTVVIPREGEQIVLEVDGRPVTLTNLSKPFWPDLGLTKADLLQYYADVAPVLLPHLEDRAMVMKRYPNGAYGAFFFMKHE